MRETVVVVSEEIFPLSCVRSFRCEFLGVYRFVPLSPYCRRRRS